MKETVLWDTVTWSELGKQNIHVERSINFKDEFYVQTVHTSSWVKDKHWRAIMQAGSARNSFRRFKNLYLYETPFKYMNTNILNLNTDIIQCAKDEFIRNILLASSRFSQLCWFLKTTTSAPELWSFAVVVLPFGFSNCFVFCSLHYYIAVG